MYYAATSAEARVCEDSTAIVVGGGNSAGQAAMFLANTSREVKVLIRGDDLCKSMSAYLCERVLKHPKIEVIKNSEVTMIHGDRNVEAISFQDHTKENRVESNAAPLFCFIGAQPHTAWLPSGVLLDDKGYIRTGAAIPATHLAEHWKLDRAPWRPRDDNAGNYCSR